jgi:hypothetical protein
VAVTWQRYRTGMACSAVVIGRPRFTQCRRQRTPQYGEQVLSDVHKVVEETVDKLCMPIKFSEKSLCFFTLIKNQPLGWFHFSCKLSR